MWHHLSAGFVALQASASYWLAVAIQSPKISHIMPRSAAAGRATIPYQRAASISSSSSAWVAEQLQTPSSVSSKVTIPDFCDTFHSLLFRGFLEICEGAMDSMIDLMKKLVDPNVEIPPCPASSDGSDQEGDENDKSDKESEGDENDKSNKENEVDEE
ncbi:hypothetical protein R3W88_000745 [Solanum pinnatisectum]|uniref:Uncharacterized protein n=1 Tax=Solanum pinnatisectum TaxID=50273 RepID=A0AAV9MGG2_9SOLN|nr:hypothetical protein R3W88_000745 [Solanum pinnatisectum]